MKYLTACLMVKDEDLYLKEWVQFHLMLGVEQIYIYDNNSVKSPKFFLKEEVAQHLVKVYNFNTTLKGRHGLCFYNFVKQHQHNSMWTMFTDIDEFVLLKKHTDLKKMLEKYEKYGGLGILQKKFTNSNHIKRPKGLVIENYMTMYHGENGSIHDRTIKTIGQLSKIQLTNTGNPHFFEYKSHFFCVDEEFNKCVRHSALKHSENLIRLNHYWTKSDEDMLKKVRIGGGNGIRRKKEMYDNFNIHKLNTKNIEITKYINELKKRMNN